MIRYKWNKEFQKVFESNKIDLDAEISFPISLKKFLNKGIVMVDGCYYFKDFAGHYSEGELFDRTGTECFNNHFHMENYCDIKESTEILRIGINFVKCLAYKLEFYSEPFCIILGYHNNSDFGIDINIRFHKIRKEETIYLEDIDTYTEEGIFLTFVNEKLLCK